MKIMISYYSKTGHTLEGAIAVAEGIRKSGSEAELVPVSDFQADALQDVDGLILGSPCWAGSLTGAGIAGPLLQTVKPLFGTFLKLV